MYPTPEFVSGKPLMNQRSVGELVPLRLVHPWNDLNLIQVRWLHDGVEICLSPTMDSSLKREALISAANLLRDRAAEMITMAECLEKIGC